MSSDSEVLKSKDSSKDGYPCNVGEGVRINEAETAGQKSQPFDSIGSGVELSDHGAGNTGHTNERSNGGECDAANSSTDAQYLG